MRLCLVGLVLPLATVAIAISMPAYNAPSAYSDEEVENPGYMVVVHTSSGELCSGFFVAPDRVLTAKHCTPATFIRYGSNGHPFPNRTTVTGHESGWFRDIALLFLNEPDYSIKPLTVNLKSDQCEQRAAMKIYGFGGSLNGGIGIGQLRSITATVHECYLIYTTTDFMSKDGSGICPGDAGGPIINANNEALAVVSGVLHSKSKGACGSKFDGTKLSRVSGMMHKYCGHCQFVE